MSCSWRWCRRWASNPHPVAAESLARLAVFRRLEDVRDGRGQGTEAASAGSLVPLFFPGCKCRSKPRRDTCSPPTAT